jgi:uncharacterized protein (DUF486 family)
MGFIGICFQSNGFYWYCLPLLLSSVAIAFSWYSKLGFVDIAFLILGETHPLNLNE